MAAVTPLAFGLSDQIVQSLRAVFGRFPAIRRVLIFGSRAKGTARPSSDIDLAVCAPALTAEEFTRLWNAIDALPLVFKVDLLHWDTLANTALKDKIVQEGQMFYAGGPADA